jgi:Flp pilus assembly protein TadG
MIESLPRRRVRDARREGRGELSRGLLKNERGAVFVEFLIAFLPVQVFFLCLVQSAILYSVRLLAEHAAVNGARAAAVVVGDEPSRYGNEAPNSMIERGERARAVRSAVILTMAPMILNGLVQSVDVFYPRADQPDGPEQTGTIPFTAMGDQSVSKVRVRVEVDAACRIGFASQIVCPSFTEGISDLIVPTRRVRAEAIFPYQGARYHY